MLQLLCLRNLHLHRQLPCYSRPRPTLDLFPKPYCNQRLLGHTALFYNRHFLGFVVPQQTLDLSPKPYCTERLPRHTALFHNRQILDYIVPQHIFSDLILFYFSPTIPATLSNLSRSSVLLFPPVQMQHTPEYMDFHPSRGQLGVQLRGCLLSYVAPLRHYI